MNNTNKFFASVCMIFIFFLIEGCTSNPPHIIEAHRIIDEHSKEMKKNGFYLFGSGGYFYKQINKFSLTYKNYTCPGSILESRKIIVEEVEKFFHKVNHDLSVRPYLKDYPYDEKSIYFEIYFKYPLDFEFSERPITIVTVDSGIIYYGIDEGRLFKDIYTEPYAEAYQKVYGRPLPARGNDTECK